MLLAGRVSMVGIEGMLNNNNGIPPGLLLLLQLMRCLITSKEY